MSTNAGVVFLLLLVLFFLTCGLCGGLLRILGVQ